MFPSTSRYLGRRSVTDAVAISQEKIKIDSRKVMFPSAFRYLGTRPLFADEVPLEKLTNELKESIGIWDDPVTRPLPVALRFDKLLSDLVKLKEYPEDMARSLSDDIDKLEISADKSTLSYAFKCYCLSKRLRVDFGLSILGRLFKKDCVPHERISRILKSDEDMLGILKENRSCETKELFKKIVRENIDIDAVTYRTLIDELCKDGHSMIAVEVLRIMDKKGHSRLDAQTLNMIIEGWIKESMIYYNLAHFYKYLCKEKKINSALESFYSLLRFDMIYRSYTRDDLVRGLCDMSLDRKIYPDVWTKGVKVEARDILGDMLERYCLQEELRKARKVFHFMERHNIDLKTGCYSSLIDGYCGKKKNIDFVMRLYREMRCKGFSPEVGTYNSILQRLFSNGRCSDALEIFDDLRVFGREPADYDTYRTMLRGLCQNRQVDQALSFLNELELIVGDSLHIEYYDIVIKGCCKDGQFEKVEDLLFRKGQVPKLGE